ncbi:MAG: hypothetical protein GY861_22640 [bacterium]|nr:hypothetical protein [bacterium]
MWLSEIRSRIQDEEEKLTDEELQACIDQAVSMYNSLGSERLVYEVVSDGGRIYDLPSDWEEDYSKIIGIEYPVYETGAGDSVYSLTYLDMLYYDIYVVNGGSKLSLNIDITDGEAFRVHYCVSRSVWGIDSVPIVNRPAVLSLSTAYAAYKMAAAYIQTMDPLISADSVDYLSKPAEYRELAAYYYEEWKSAMESRLKRRSGSEDPLGAGLSGLACGTKSHPLPFSNRRLFSRYGT